MPTLEEAVEVIRAGDRETGRQMLEEILEEDENNEEVWLWLGSVVDSDEDREICFENVLALNPDNIVAQKGLEALRSGTFNVHDMTDDLLPADSYYDDDEDDQFSLDKDDEFDFESDEIEWPAEMDAGGATPASGTKKKGKKAAPKKKGGGFNPRLIIIAVIVLLVLAAGGFAGFILLSGGGEETPANNGEVPVQATEEALPTDTPAPTDTPTVTPTPTFALPTARPTGDPTPTATTVVSPTPSN